MPHFVPEENLATANSLSLVASYGTFPLAGAITAALAVVAGWLGGFEALHSLKTNAAIPALWFDAITYIVSAVIVFGLPIPRRRKRGDRSSSGRRRSRRSRTGFSFIRTDRFARAVIVGLGGGVIGAGAMVPLEPVFATEVLGSKSEFGVLLFALGHRRARSGCSACSRSRSGCRATRSSSGRSSAPASALATAAAFNVGGLAAVMIAVVGAFAGAAYVTGFTLLQEHVTDELRGRTFATLYAVVRLCLLAVADGLAAVRRPLRVAVQPGRRRAATSRSAGSATPSRACASRSGAVRSSPIVSGLYARRELRAMRALAVQHRHPANAARRRPGPDADDGAAGRGPATRRERRTVS